jgi:hypothetical protein
MWKMTLAAKPASGIFNSSNTLQTVFCSARPYSSSTLSSRHRKPLPFLILTLMSAPFAKEFNLRKVGAKSRRHQRSAPGFVDSVDSGA